MKTSHRGGAAIALREGLVTRAYRDVAGIWTIGVGHTASAGPPVPKAGMTITRAEAMEILARDLATFEKRVAAALGPVAQHVFDGAVSFDFNTGAIHKASWVRAFKAGDMARAERLLKLYNKAGGKVVKGLVARRDDEADLIFRGQYPAGIVAIELGPVASPAYTSPEVVRAYQRQLAVLGFDPGPVDGDRGQRTIAALKVFQAANNLIVDGIYGPATKATLDRVHAERTGATTAEPDPKHPDDVEPDAPAEPDAAPAADAGGISGIAIVVVIVAFAVFSLLKAFGVA